MALPTPSHRPRVMMDTSVLIAGSGWPRWPHEVLLAGLRGEFQLVLSSYILKETRYTLQKRFPEHRDRFEDFMARTPYELVPDPSQEELWTSPQDTILLANPKLH